MRGNPKYTYGDIVKFSFSVRTDKGTEKIEKEGIVAIVDKYGVFEDDSDVHYDILVPEENMLYKHVKETKVSEKTGETTPPFGVLS